MSPTTSSIRRRPRHTMTVLMAGLATVALAAPALAVTATMGNPAVDRPNVDAWWDTTTVDTNHPSPFDGSFTQIDYQAARAGSIRFVVVDASGTVTWVSDPLDVDGPGAGTVDLPGPVGVSAGSNLGVYYGGEGVIAFDIDPTAAPILQEDIMAGLPAVGDPLQALDPNALYAPGRIYSMEADITAASPQICKQDGWQTWGYRNQGQCIASVVANEHSGH